MSPEAEDLAASLTLRLPDGRGLCISKADARALVADIHAALGALAPSPADFGTTPMAADLAQRLVAHPRWTWTPGMLAVRPNHDPPESLRIVHVENGEPAAWTSEDHTAVDIDVQTWAHDGWPDDTVLDLTDPATVGCLLAMLGRPTEVPCGWVLDWHGGADLGETVARALLASWSS